jgi:hypothetical protein
MKKIILVLTVALIPHFCHSQIISSIFDKANHLVSKSIAQVDNTANYTVNQSVNQLQMLLYTAHQRLSDDLNHTMQSLKGENLVLMTKIVTLTNSLAKGEGSLIHLEDNATLDLNDLLGNLPFIDKEFIMRRAVGFNHLYKASGDYSMSVTGSNFGFSSNLVKVKFNNILINDHSIISTVDLNNNTDNNTKVIRIRSAVLNPYFQPKNVRAVKVTFIISREEYKGYFKKRWRNTGSITNSFLLYLFPDYSGPFKFQAVSEILSWIDDGTAEVTKIGPDASGGHGSDYYGIPWQIDISAVSGFNSPTKKGDLRLSNPQITPIFGPAGFDLDVSCELTNNNTAVTGHVRSRTSPTTYRLSAKKWIYDVVGKESRDTTCLFRYDKIYNLSYPLTLTAVTVSGVSVANGQNFNYSLDEPNPIFEVVSRNPTEREITYQIRLKRPPEE